MTRVKPRNTRAETVATLTVALTAVGVAAVIAGVAVVWAVAEAAHDLLAGATEVDL